MYLQQQHAAYSKRHSSEGLARPSTTPAAYYADHAAYSVGRSGGRWRNRYVADEIACLLWLPLYGPTCGYCEPGSYIHLLLAARAFARRYALYSRIRRRLFAACSWWSASSGLCLWSKYRSGGQQLCHVSLCLLVKEEAGSAVLNTCCYA